MRALAMVGRMLPANHVKATTSATLRAQDAARDRGGAAGLPGALAANGLSVLACSCTQMGPLAAWAPCTCLVRHRHVHGAHAAMVSCVCMYVS